MGRFQDFLTQNSAKTYVLNRVSRFRREVSRARQREAQLIWGPIEQIRRYQLERFRRLVGKAREAPYWRGIVDQFGKPADQFTLADLNQFPFLTKELMRSHGENMRVRSAAGVYVNYSGGSTGEPIQFYQDETYKIHMSVATEMCNGMAGAFPGARVAKLWGAPQDRRQIEGLYGRARLWALNQRYYDTFDMGAERMERYHADLERFQPDLIQAYASSIDLLAGFLESRGIRPSYPRRGIISTAERLRPEMRERIERVFPAPVFNRYGSREVSAMAAECDRHTGLHVHMPGYIVETIDPATGAPVHGRPGEIAITVLNNYAMPFIRYRIGDLGILTRQPCGCGRTTERLSEITGRTSDNFVMPDGRIVHGEYFTHLFYGKPEVAQFQFEQETRESFVLRIVPSAGFRTTLSECFEREVRNVIGDRVSFRVEVCQEIPKTASGKYRFTLSRVDAREAILAGSQA